MESAYRHHLLCLRCVPRFTPALPGKQLCFLRPSLKVNSCPPSQEQIILHYGSKAPRTTFTTFHNSLSVCVSLLLNTELPESRTLVFPIPYSISILSTYLLLILDLLSRPPELQRLSSGMFCCVFHLFYRHVLFSLLNLSFVKVTPLFNSSPYFPVSLQWETNVSCIKLISHWLSGHTI